MAEHTDRDPVRQYRITVTDTPERGSLEVILSWRTFPAAANHWDGRAYATVPRQGIPLVASQDDLRAVLGDLAAVPWRTGLRQ